MDDLSAFFAKKAQKSKDRKKKVNVGDIAKQLERTARIHERAEREEAERQLKEEQQVHSTPKNEDSEWLEDADEDLTSKLEAIGIKGMDVSELTDEEEEEEEKGETEPAKTWNFEQNGTATVENDRAEDLPPVKTRYVPPINRFGGARRGGNQPQLDLKNEEMFPSIANADKMEKEMSKLEDKNTKVSAQGGWKTQGENTEAKQAQGAPGVYRPPQRSNFSRPPATQGRVTPNNSTPPTNKYVIPSKRA